MAQQETQAFKQLKEQLREMFQLDRGDLDFGLYRIMNQKRDDVTKFLDEQLLPQVRSVLEDYQPVGIEEKKKELKEAEANPAKFSAEYVEGLRKELNQSVDMGKIENEIYSDLYNFFKRYYSDGDFMSMRRYKEGVYALPYEGEEVKLHWANHDQYYIKTSENLKNYTFKAIANKRVRFEVVAGGTETNNNKAAEGKERRFILHADAPTEINGDELIIRFEYRPDDKKRKQDNISKETLEQLFNLAEISSFGLNEKAPTEKNADRTLLEKHLNDYTAKHSFDYFIHKDLGKFLGRELDFYIKNEIMHLDDIENETAPKVETYLAKVKAMRKVAGKIIQFLAQLEDFQKKLWLKKKFVLETHYCVTLDHLFAHEADMHDVLHQIAINGAQIGEWVKLFAIDELDGFATPLPYDFLKTNDKLLVDTKFFDADFKYSILSIFDDLDAQTDGLLINSENFQALNLLQERYKEKVQCIYIDPPYNSPSSEIIYKNTFKHSAWLTLMHDRVKLSKVLLDRSLGVLSCAIDENEQDRLSVLLGQVFPSDFYEKNCLSIRHNTKGIQGGYISVNNEYSLIFSPNGVKSYNKPIKKENWEYNNFRNWGGESERNTAKNCFYPIYVKDGEIIGFGDVSDDDYHPNHNEHMEDGSIAVYPVDGKGVERKWTYARQSVEAIIRLLKVEKLSDGNWEIKKCRDTQRYKTFWDETKYIAGDYGSKILNHMMGEKKFDFPKSLYTVYDALSMSSSHDDIVLDYFSGSGTTAHAVIQLNRDEEKSDRKFILIEMGEYFDIVTKPRVLKSLYSENWKSGKPTDRKGRSGLFKYFTPEQYEDALDNLGFNKSETQSGLLASNPTLNEQYMLGYMLDVESRGSQSLLNIDAFADPFAYTLRITRNDDTQVVNVDLIETFNYLLGLTVRTVDRDKSGIVTVTGKNSLDENCLIIWRNTAEIDNAKLDAWFGKRYSSKDFEFDAIYVNGDNNIENMKLADDHWKVRLTESEFKRLMFDVQDV